MKLKNTTVYIFIGILHLVYLYIGMSNKGLQNMSFFYLFLYDGALIPAFLIFRDEAIEKLKLAKITIVGVAFGIIVGEMLVLIELGFYGAFSYVIPVVPSEAVRGYIYMIFVAFVIGNSEEMFFRGFLPAIAERISDGEQDLKLAKYLFIPAIFSLAHYFAWSSSIFNNLLFSVYMFLYHFTFAVAMQFLVDYYDNQYTAITAHTLYDATKMLMSIA